jgi:DNA-binding response OmpR family regulator
MSDQPLAVIIEDDQDLSFIFAEALRAAGFKAEVRRDGKGAIECLEELRPKVVVLDLHLPHVAGTEILKQIRASETLQHTRVVITTADARMAEQTDRLADFVLIKPISFSLLRDLASRLSKDQPGGRILTSRE